MSSKIETADKNVQTEDFIEEEYDSSSDSESTISEERPCFIDTVSDDDLAEIHHTIYEAVDEYMESNILNMKNPDFHKTLVDDISHIVFQHLMDAEICEDEDYEDIREQVEVLHEHYFEIAEIPLRSIHNDLEAGFREDPDNISDELRRHVAHLKELEQAVQKTPEWYETRHRMLTASNLWKIFSTESQYNSLVYEKCQPNPPNSADTYVNVDSTLHWGNKYEDLTTMVYESKEGVRADSLGCLTHPKYPYLGASPDGIVVSDKRFGRLIEIKNIVNREINVPSEAYWIQMQLQLEVCDLDICDFVETRFKEYETEELFWEDTEHSDKGVILMFYEKTTGKKNYNPTYVYMPLNIEISKPAIEEWINNTIASMNETHIFHKNIFWYLDEYSCVKVKRNRAWFAAALPKIEEAWATIQKERIEGYAHRMAKKRPKASANKIDIVAIIKLEDFEPQNDIEQSGQEI